MGLWRLLKKIFGSTPPKPDPPPPGTAVGPPEDVIKDIVVSCYYAGAPREEDE